MNTVSELINLLNKMPKDASIDAVLGQINENLNKNSIVAENKESTPSENVIMEEVKSESPKEEPKEVEQPKEEPKEEPYKVPEFLQKVYDMFAKESVNINFSETTENAVLRNVDKKYVSVSMINNKQQLLEGLYKVEFYPDGETVKNKYYNYADKVNKPHKVELNEEGNILSETWSPDMGKTIYRNDIVGYGNGAILHYDPKVGKVIKEEYYTKDGKLYCEASLTYSE